MEIEISSSLIILLKKKLQAALLGKEKNTSLRKLSKEVTFDLIRY